MLGANRMDVPLSTARMLREGLWTLLEQRYTMPTEYQILCQYNPSTAELSVTVYHALEVVAEYIAD